MIRFRNTRTIGSATRILTSSCLFGLFCVAAVSAMSAMSSEQPRKVEGDVIAPKAIQKVQPKYPEEARKDRVTGAVVVQAVIDEQGLITGAKVLQSVREDLDQAAIDAIRQWKFDPATLEGDPVAVYYNLTINFKLDKDKKKES